VAVRAQPKLLKCDHDSRRRIRRGSSIIGPLGEELVSRSFGCETVLVANPDLNEFLLAKFDFDAVSQ
jgi:hypothetical protein